MSPLDSDDNKMSDLISLQSVQAKLAKAKGPAFWRSLDELSAAEGFQDFLHREFPARLANGSTMKAAAIS